MYKELRDARPELTLQQFKTFKGQLAAGDAEGMRKGLRRLRGRENGGRSWEKQRG